MLCCWCPLLASASPHSLASWYMWSRWTVQACAIRCLQLEINRTTSSDKSPHGIWMLLVYIQGSDWEIRLTVLLITISSYIFYKIYLYIYIYIYIKREIIPRFVAPLCLLVVLGIIFVCSIFHIEKIIYPPGKIRLIQKIVDILNFS